MNEAAIITARRELSTISKEEIADALERIIAGPEKTGVVVTENKRRLVAYHEAGHALVGALMPEYAAVTKISIVLKGAAGWPCPSWRPDAGAGHALVGALMPEYDAVTKISIVPRGAAGGLTFFAPSEERLESGLYSRSYLENKMAVALGGRIAEELIFGEDNITTEVVVRSSSSRRPSSSSPASSSRLVVPVVSSPPTVLVILYVVVVFPRRRRPSSSVVVVPSVGFPVVVVVVPVVVVPRRRRRRRPLPRRLVVVVSPDRRPRLVVVVVVVVVSSSSASVQSFRLRRSNRIRSCIQSLESRVRVVFVVGASGDFQQVARIARLMVTQLGFCKDLGQVAWSSGSEFSMETADRIDQEVKQLVERAYRRAKDLVQCNVEVLHKAAAVLLEKENLDGEEFMQIVMDSQAENYTKKDAPGLTIPYQQAYSSHMAFRDKTEH
eukprot:gene32254-16821_t